MPSGLVTVLIPTHDHGDLIEFAIRSVLRQTYQNFELFVIGDGISAAGKQCVNHFANADSRIRLFEFPKGERNGEAYRHPVLTDYAKGEYVCYLGDDDMYMPGFLAETVKFLRSYDFVHPLPGFITTQREFGVAVGDLRIHLTRNRIIEDNSYNFISLTGAAHTMELYRKLPYGWRTTPLGLATDHYMWQQILAFPGCRAHSTNRLVTLKFPAGGRRGWTQEQRRAELASWEKFVEDPQAELQLLNLALDTISLTRVWEHERLRALEGKI